MNQKVEFPPTGGNGVKCPVQRRIIGNIHIQKKIRTDPFGKWPHTFAEPVTLIGECQFCPMGGKLMGNAPGNGLVIRDAHHKPALTLHNIRHTNPK